MLQNNYPRTLEIARTRLERAPTEGDDWYYSYASDIGQMLARTVEVDERSTADWRQFNRDLGSLLHLWQLKDTGRTTHAAYRSLHLICTLLHAWIAVRVPGALSVAITLSKRSAATSEDLAKYLGQTLSKEVNVLGSLDRFNAWQKHLERATRDGGQELAVENRTLQLVATGWYLVRGGMMDGEEGYAAFASQRLAVEIVLAVASLLSKAAPYCPIDAILDRITWPVDGYDRKQGSNAIVNLANDSRILEWDSVTSITGQLTEHSRIRITHLGEQWLARIKREKEDKKAT